MPVMLQEPELGLLVSVAVALVVHEPVPAQTAALKLPVEGCAYPLPASQVTNPPPLAGPTVVAKFSTELVETATILGLPLFGAGFDTEAEVDDEKPLEPDSPLLPPAIYA